MKKFIIDSIQITCAAISFNESSNLEQQCINFNKLFSSNFVRFRVRVKLMHFILSLNSEFKIGTIKRKF